MRYILVLSADKIKIPSLRDDKYIFIEVVEVLFDLWLSVMINARRRDRVIVLAVIFVAVIIDKPSIADGTCTDPELKNMGQVTRH